MNLNTSSWKTFLLSSLYSIEMGNKFDKNKMTCENPAVDFVSRQGNNNGVDSRVDLIEDVPPYKAGLITIALGGQIGACFVQTKDFYTAQNIVVLTPRFKEMCLSVNLFISTLVKYECRFKYYPFGRELNIHINKDFSIKLPVASNGNPDWEFIKNYVNSLHYKPLTTKITTTPDKPDIRNWKKFLVSDIFTIQNGKGISKDEIEEFSGDFPAVQSGELNNGVLGFIDKAYCKAMNYTMTAEPCLTVARTGTAGFVAFQENGCVVGDSAKILLLKNEMFRNKYIYLFLATILNSNRYKFSYGRKVTEEKYTDMVLKLPATSGGNPDYQFMENYIKSLPYSDRI